jgi:hypothetical protein
MPKVKALAIPAILVASASVAFAQSRPPYSSGYGPYAGAPGGYYYPEYPIAPYRYSVL